MAKCSQQRVRSAYFTSPLNIEEWKLSELDNARSGSQTDKKRSCVDLVWTWREFPRSQNQKTGNASPVGATWLEKRLQRKNTYVGRLAC